MKAKTKLKVRRNGQCFLAGGVSWKAKDCMGGGNSHISHPKKERPFHSRAALHVVLKSSQAKGSLSFLSKERQVHQRVKNLAERFYIDLKDFANSGNHLHLLIRARSRDYLNAFLKSLTGLLMRMMTGAQRNHARSLDIPFWDARPFSRIVGEDERKIRNYLKLNRMEIQEVFTREIARKILPFYHEQKAIYSQGLWRSA